MQKLITNTLIKENEWLEFSKFYLKLKVLDYISKCIKINICMKILIKIFFFLKVHNFV